MKQRIVLIGFRGSGKTTIGKRLAELLGWNFISTDALIEREIGASISEWVEKNGWENFREKEKAVIRSLPESDNMVIDCGGGVVEDAQNMELLQRYSLIVWVDAEEADIYRRLLRENDRPLLNQADLREDIRTNYRRRQPLYRQYSRIYVNSSQNSTEEICQYIIEKAEEK